MIATIEMGSDPIVGRRPDTRVGARLPANVEPAVTVKPAVIGDDR